MVGPVSSKSNATSIRRAVYTPGMNHDLSRIVALCVLAACLPCGNALAATLEIGPQKRFTRIEDAVAVARAGDEVRVFPLAGGQAYPRVALRPKVEKLRIIGVHASGQPRVRLSGEGFDYSGVGAVPRAIVQFDSAANGCVLEGFDLSGARNQSANGAGVRINGANDINIRDCEIHDNDMGIMSGGELSAQTGVNQLIESCLIHSNGTGKDPGQNHNLYLGGTSVTLSACEVRNSTTGHNVKSRAHHTRVEYCYIHDSANRELDLVDGAGATDAPNSDAVLLGNIIAKANPCRGNRMVINFGQDGGHDHLGAIYLMHNTVVTPYAAPVVNLSAPGARAELVNNIFWNGASDQHNQHVSGFESGPRQVAAQAQGPIEQAKRVTGSHNWFSATFAEGGGLGFLSEHSTVGGRNQSPAFLDVHHADFRIKSGDTAIGRAGETWQGISLPMPAGADAEKRGLHRLWQYKAPLGKTPRRANGPADLGAFDIAD